MNDKDCKRKPNSWIQSHTNQSIFLFNVNIWAVIFTKINRLNDCKNDFCFTVSPTAFIRAWQLCLGSKKPLTDFLFSSKHLRHQVVACCTSTRLHHHSPYNNSCSLLYISCSILRKEAAERPSTDQSHLWHLILYCLSPLLICRLDACCSDGRVCVGGGDCVCRWSERLVKWKRGVQREGWMRGAGGLAEMARPGHRGCFPLANPSDWWLASIKSQCWPPCQLLVNPSNCLLHLLHLSDRYTHVSADTRVLTAHARHTSAPSLRRLLFLDNEESIDLGARTASLWRLFRNTSV